MAKGKSAGGKRGAGDVPLDLHRAIVFPNRMREQRRRHGFAKLLPFAAAIPDIPYIRLSKIERGEVVARPEELTRIAAALGIAPADLLIDIDAPGFDEARWAEPFGDGSAPDLAEERFAVLLGAALKAKRTREGITIATLEADYGLAPVNLSRVENAAKPWARWSAATQQALLTLFGAADEGELRDHVAAEHRHGALDDYLSAVANPAARHDRIRARIEEVAAALIGTDAPPPPKPAAPAPRTARMLPVIGGALPGGLIADTPSGDKIEPPSHAGPRAFALRLPRATLGVGMPAGATLIADPDRHPAPGGLALLQESEGWRLLAVASDRDGRMIGFSTNPEHEAPLDDAPAGALAAVIAALLPG